MSHGLDPLPVFEAQGPHRFSAAFASYGARRERLLRLREALEARREAFLAALGEDLRKPREEAYLTELHPTMAELNHALGHLRRWMRPQRVGTPLSLLGTRSRILREPKGRVLILAPWNYPAFLLLTPLIAALAGGNAVILKPSEKTPATEAFLKELIEATFAPHEVALFTGGPEVAQALLDLPFDHVFFTGSTRVGRLVMAAAAKHLAGVTLELGGKSPAVVTPTADLATAARRIAWAKWLNAGQTCVAPDYVLVPAAREAAFLAALEAAVRELYPDPPLPRLVDGPALERQRALLKGCGGTVRLGGQVDATGLGLEPTVVTGVDLHSPLMQEEIFGPILPVLAYRDQEEARAILRDRDQPLASYIFSGDRTETEHWLRETRAGGSVVNHALIHLGNPGLPFGGRGPSGLGAYHGRHGFDTFTHPRAVLEAGWLDTVAFTFPPYGGAFKRAVFRFLRWLE
jgi:aldehyde dehydrogenase (NAD+)